MNMFLAIGNLTRDPEIRYTDNGKPVARFTLAVARRYNRNDADFLPCVAFNKTAEFIEKYMQKGSKVAVEAHVQTGSYEKDGRTVYTTEFIIDHLEFAGSANKAQEADNSYGDFVNVADVTEEELPFN